MDIHTVLVPTDFSEHAEHAFIWAVSLAEQWHARIVLVHAVPLLHHVSVPERLLIDLPHLDTDRVIEAEKHLQDFLTEKRKPASVTVETRIVRGDPFWAICQAAEQEHADLIVMGSHGRTGLAHVLLGSVAERVVRHAPCPVLISRRSPAQ
jgi:nucleotide-binding universal stress UspA family protein